MAGASLLTLIDDIASLLDDVALMSKLAAKKTAGVLGDDLALNAQQVTGVSADRELPVVWAVAKGSLINKAILVPSALIISMVLPSAILPLLMLGGLYLCFEGVEKLVPHAPKAAAPVDPPALSDESIVLLEKTKIKGAIRTDFILSAEIVVLSLGQVANSPVSVRILSLVVIGLLMTVGVYGFVAAIVKLDDLGRYLVLRGRRDREAIGRALLWSAPFLMKGLSVAGTIAMFLVGGGIVVHAIGPIHYVTESLPGVVQAIVQAGIGIVCGALVLGFVELVRKLRE